MKINISIDDVSPHPMSSVKVLDRCFELIEIFPDIKFSLFVPISYWRTVRPEIATQQPLQIDMFPDFCNTIKNLPKNNFEICYHGFFHGIPGKSDNDEFQHLTYEQAREKFDTMFSVVEKSGLQEIFKLIFRPPAWRMSPNAIRAAKDAGIKILALSPKDYAKQTYQGAENNFNKIVYYNCAPPFDPLKNHSCTEVVYHACEWDKNYMSQEICENLKIFLLEQDNIEFCFLEDLTP